MNRSNDTEHLVRVVVVFLVGFVLFLSLRAWFVPKSFGQFGHYRGDAPSEIAALPIVHAGHETCEICHSEVFDKKKIGKHAGVNCEACHGPQAKHAEDPGSVKPVLPDTSILCARCHEANSAKPKWFPAVVTAEHAMGMACNTCHTPHSPKIEGERK
jgi:Cytochrome c554 and c-prime